MPKEEKILFLTLSNIGDVILTLPALDLLKKRFPSAKVIALSGPRPKEIFENNPGIERFITYDKHSSLKEKIRLFMALRKERFDMVADLRNSFFGAFLPSRRRTSPFLIIPKSIKHMRDRHLYRVKGKGCISPSNSLYISEEDKRYVQGLLRECGISDKDKLVVLAAGARSHIKRWPADRFAELANRLIRESGVKVLLVGDKEDAGINKYIAGQVQPAVSDLSAKTTISQLACLLKKASLVITNDSAVLHLASYLNTPVLAIFGPTDEAKYGPWSEISAVVKKDISCRPCQKAQCRFGSLECMQLIKTEDVLSVARKILSEGKVSEPSGEAGDFKRILIVRTDRVGDLVLSTPVIKALRQHYRNAYIAVMVNPYTREIVERNPYLDEVIIYDKERKHKNWWRSVKFASALRKKKFDLAIILHPTNRVHLVTLFAGIPRRIGYNRKLGFLLTDRIRHTKQLGEKQELEYNLDLIRHLGIEPKDKELYLALDPASEEWADITLNKEGIDRGQRLILIHPGASCPSKIWPNERFAQVADRLIEKYGLKVFIVSGPKDIALAEKVAKEMRYPAINLAGKTSLSQLASILRRSSLFISNDSGPVHIASAVGTPVISIFGRRQPGLSPRRWGPLGARDKVLYKDVGCLECLAHNCVKGFACLKAISVEDVLGLADALLGG